jgi:hypothetical protein
MVDTSLKQQDEEKPASDKAESAIENIRQSLKELNRLTERLRAEEKGSDSS